MNTKVIIAIAAVAIVVIAGSIAAFALSNDSEESLDVDTPKTVNQLAINDFYSGSANLTISTDNTDTAIYGFLIPLYYYSGDPSGTKEITYKGTKIMCDVYKVTMSTGEEVSCYYNEPKSGVNYYSRYVDPDGFVSESTLKDSNLDLSKGSSDQDVKKGSYYTYQYSGTVAGYDGTFTGESETKMTDFNETTRRGVATVTINVKSEPGNYKGTIKGFDYNGDVIIKESVNKRTRDVYLGMVSYDSLLKYSEKNGYTITHGEKTSKTIDTEFGKRKVTIEALKMVKDKETKNITVTYGEKGLIYKQEIDMVNEKKRENSTFILKDTNLIVKKQDDTKPTAMETLRTDLKVGDSIAFTERIAYKFEIPDKDTKEEIIGDHYYDIPPNLEKTKITYKGKQIDCFIYEMPEKKAKAYISVDSGFCYVLEESQFDGLLTTTLADTNMDVSKKKDDLVLSNGSFIDIKVSGRVSSTSDGEITLKKTITSVNDDGTYGTISNIASTVVTDHTRTIKEIGPYGKLVVDTTEDKEIKSKDHFLDVIGIGFYHESFKTSGQNATVVGDEVTEVIDTVFGKRTVSVRTMVNTTIPDNPVTFKIYYGINGVIYKIEYTTKDLASTVTLKSSNLLTTVA